jgi:hypothetical protein
VGLLAVRLGSDQDIYADFEAGGFMNDLITPVPSAKPLGHVEHVESIRDGQRH